MLKEENKKKIILVVGIVVIMLLIWLLLIHPYITFKSREKEVLNAAKRYYEINSTKLPTGTKLATLSLKTLYEKDLVDTSPNSAYATNKCNIENSFVKVRKENNEYQYYVYLQCGLFKSSMDHEGPNIKLKGKEEMTLYRGDKYKEPGVESVKDNTDGSMNIKNVQIDSSKVNTNKNGTYEVTYKIKDSFHNETVKKRIIKVVQTLNNVVKKEASGNTYKGSHDNGYIKIDEILFRIVGINEDDSVKVVSNDALASINYEGIDDWLNDYFYNKLSDNIKKYIVNSKWCNENVSNPDNTTKCNKYGKKRNIGLLSVADINKSKGGEDEYYLNDTYTEWLQNGKNDKKAWTHMYINNDSGEAEIYKDISIDGIYGIRPALNIKKDAMVSSGSGSYEAPYILKGNKKNSKKGEKISGAKTGSYIDYSGYTWRVIGRGSDSTTNIIMISSINSGDGLYFTNFDTKASNYNPNRESNLGYKIVNDVTTYIKTNYLANKEIEVPSYKNKVIYHQQNNIKKYKVKLAAISLFDLFSNESSSASTAWYREGLNNKTVAYINPSVGIASEYAYNETDNYSVRVVGYLLKDIVIKDGDGTSDNPYKITK